MTINTSKFPERFLQGYIANAEQKDKARPLLKLRYEYLEDIINTHKYKTICELGSGQGVPALYVLKNCPSIEEYICIDPDTLRPGMFAEKEFLGVRSKNRFIKKTAIEGAKDVQDNYFDLVYMDYLSMLPRTPKILKETTDNILVWKNKVKYGGILCGHDYCRVDDRFTHINQTLEKLFPFGVNRIIESQRYLDLGMCVHFWWVYIVDEHKKEIEHYNKMKSNGEIDEKRHNSLVENAKKHFKNIFNEKT